MWQFSDFGVTNLFVNFEQNLNKFERIFNQTSCIKAVKTSKTNLNTEKSVYVLMYVYIFPSTNNNKLVSDRFIPLNLDISSINSNHSFNWFPSAAPLHDLQR